MGNWTVPAPSSFMPAEYLLFNGKKLVWKSRRNKNLADSYINLHIWNYAVSGLKKNNKHVQTLIDAGRDDIESGKDYTDPKYQGLSSAGPIPAGDYSLALSPTMAFEKTGGGWGAGGWSIYPKNQLVRSLGFAEGKFEMDLPWVRSGFFLHEDGGRDGTAGCIGLSGRGIKNLQSYLKKLVSKTQALEMLIVVDYQAKDP